MHSLEIYTSDGYVWHLHSIFHGYHIYRAHIAQVLLTCQGGVSPSFRTFDYCIDNPFCFSSLSLELILCLSSLCFILAWSLTSDIVLILTSIMTLWHLRFMEKIFQTPPLIRSSILFFNVMHSFIECPWFLWYWQWFEGSALGGLLALFGITMTPVARACSRIWVLVALKGV